jgi:hypothetical protein
MAAAVPTRSRVNTLDGSGWLFAGNGITLFNTFRFLSGLHGLTTVQAVFISSSPLHLSR